LRNNFLQTKTFLKEPKKAMLKELTPINIVKQFLKQLIDKFALR